MDLVISQIPLQPTHYFHFYCFFLFILMPSVQSSYWSRLGLNAMRALWFEKGGSFEIKRQMGYGGVRLDLPQQTVKMYEVLLL